MMDIPGAGLICAGELLHRSLRADAVHHADVKFMGAE